MSEVKKCRECGGENLLWTQCNSNKTGIAEGRLRTHEVTCSFVLGCEDCSETIAVISAEKFISNYDASQAELAALREELERQTRYVEINANSAHGKHKEGQQYEDERDALREELAEKQALSEVFYQRQLLAENKLKSAERLNARLTKAISDAEHYADRGKVWSEAGCTYTGLHSYDQQKVIDILRAALNPTESGASE